MATLKMAGSSLFGTIADTAGAVSDVVKSVSTGAKMINDYAEHARKQQLINIKLNSVGYEEQRLAEKTAEIAASQNILREYIAANPDQEANCNEIYQKLKAALA